MISLLLLLLVVVAANFILFYMEMDKYFVNQVLCLLEIYLCYVDS